MKIFFALCIFVFILISISISTYSQETYPQLDITGYKKYEYSSLSVDSLAHLFQAQTLLGGYYAGGPWQERLRLKITGKLSEKLSVSYDLEQQPDLPDKYNVKVVYDKTELIFGDFNATFGGNEFANTTKFLNGVMITSKDKWYDVVFVPSSKLKSYTQHLATQKGNNSKGPYNLGHSSIIEGSETVELNNVKLKRGVDYTINYFEGTITFSRILSTEDVFKYNYEYTNIIDLFFPTVSKRDFIGLRVNTLFDPELMDDPRLVPERSVKREIEFFPTMLKLEESKPIEIQKAVPPKITLRKSAKEAVPSTEILIKNTVIMKIHDTSIEASTKKAEIIASKIRSSIDSSISSDEVRINATEIGVVITIKDDTIVIVDEVEAKFHNTSAEALANLWKENIKLSLSATSEIETIVVTPELGILEEYEWESTGVYKLKNSPLLQLSEELFLKGRKLKKFEDYIVDYNTGTITLFSPTLPTVMEPLRVEYKYIEIIEEAEILPGSGFGPYHLSHKNVISGSETVLVNNIPYVRDLDYVIDYENGTILFATSISETSNIQIKYKHVVMITPSPPEKKEIPKVFSIGGTYLKESGRSGASLPTTTIQETFSGSDIIDNNDLIYLNFRPLTSTNEVTIIQNGVEITYEVDYVIPTYDAIANNPVPAVKLAYITDANDESNGLYTGTIYFKSTLEADDTIKVSYKYNKWSQERYTGSGIENKTGPYRLTNARNIVPGTEIVQIWRTGISNPVIKTLTRNSSIGASDGHYSINYNDPPEINFNEKDINIDSDIYPVGDINFTIIYKFVPRGTISQQDIAHEVYGIDGTFKYGDFASAAVTLAQSRTDQIITIISTNETFNGNGTDESFTLGSKGNIIEGSEQVYVNLQKINRDSQYYFTYDKPGGITFYTVAPSTRDSISIDYDYQDPTGPVQEKDIKVGNAYTISGSITPIKELSINAEYKEVEEDFSPLGGTSIPIGSNYKHIYSKLTPIHNFWISGDYKEQNNPIANKPDQFLHSYDTNVSGGFNPYGFAQIDFSTRNYRTLDDVLIGENHNNDYQSNSYSLGLKPKQFRYGEFAFTNSNDIRKTISQTDVFDSVLPKDSITDYGHMNNTFEFTRRVKWILDYQVSESTDISYEAGARKSGSITANTQSNDLSSNLSWDLTYAPIQRLSTYWNRKGHNEFDFVNDTIKSTLNETYHLDFIPISQITTSLNHDRQETLSVFTELGNPRTGRTTATTKLTPYSNTSVNWSGSKDDSIHDNGTKTSGHSNTYTINHTPISESLYKVTTDFSLSTSTRLAPGSPSTIDIQTDTRSFSQSYGLTVTPLKDLNVTGGYIQEDYSNVNDDQANPINTQSKNQTLKSGTAYKVSTDLDVSVNYSSKLTMVPDIKPKPKVNLDAHAAYKVFTYGTLNFDWSQERNQGEILSGAFVDQDFIKTLQSLSLNVVFPQTGEVILSSIVLKGSIKWADYEDRKSSANSFKASMIAFEGSLNF